MAEIAGKAFGLAHRYMQGIRFDGVWEYQVVAASGRKRWQSLPPDSEHAQRTDSEDHLESLAWCLRRCTAVMTKRPMGSIAVQLQLAEQAINSVVWEALFPACEIRHSNAIVKASMNCLARVLERGGCALLKLALHRAQRRDSEPAGCWVWVVGVEVQKLPEPEDRHWIISDEMVRAALVVSHSWAAPWGSGFGARVSWDAVGRCILCSVDGERLQGRCADIVVIEPKRA
ncbi:hypothetical protein G7047_13655 [Diaphorobacter sp. HDW4A]|uniref:hypothetical protein n=1 Tax=Diaphorobacter sp. HDW4A TaxID=2714924 RepID=UPI0014096547|nr:hypothetical protein [Diaphorobacter sp. HDW4A]QIL80834.1 hypothetical protein G7047_13655 [Diaphorobacter sp. HDW4A]